MSDVAIIGGGLAGLAAARTLRASGYRCTIFESGDALGGRVRSDMIDDITVDRGLQLMNSWYPAVKELLRPGEYSALGLKNFPPAFQTLTDEGLAMFCDPVRAPHLILPFMRSKFGSALSIRDVFGLRKWLGSEMTHKSSLELRKMKPSRLQADVPAAESLSAFGVNRQMRKLVVNPLMEAFLFDPQGESSALFAKWMVAALLRGTLGVPENGMGELSAALGRQSGVRVVLGAKVTGVREVAGGGVEVQLGERGETETFPYVIMACGAAAEHELLGTPQPATVPVATWWMVSEEPVGGNSLITVDGARRTPISSAAELTAVAPGYAPHRHLVAANVVGVMEPDLPGDAEMLGHVSTLLEADTSRWQVVTRQFYRDATPIIPPRRTRGSGTIALAGEFHGERIVLAGSQHATPTVDGALRSGQRAAKELLKVLPAA
ncbi:MAG TPA: FAD-dependent oxidoreductase [Candidatus Corynebacterium gallistercoris]|uniref:FAD-dependent oxidoreductase n=1 Tax=Candidatus Corynebacterium gallistercoris TaxID=2838530 RepID=A0A9D1RWT8_9CORY|nr:FAD-dependent oxidoreductase [Candidatus Corynebacterium gallistercoris]